jgi:hypothetical protein
MDVSAFIHLSILIGFMAAVSSKLRDTVGAHLTTTHGGTPCVVVNR